MMRPVSRPVLLAAVTLAFAVCLCPALAEAQALPVLDHFWCYGITDKSPDAQVILRDQFDAAGTAGQPFVVRNPLRFCNPVMKTTAAGITTPITDPDGHLKLYLAPPSHIEDVRSVVVKNQFGRRQRIRTYDPLLLGVPTAKNTQGFPEKLDHFKCYRAYGAAPRSTIVRLKDQFHDATVTVGRPVLHCNPVEKRHGAAVVPIQHPEAHLLCYYVTKTALPDAISFFTRNQFGEEQLRATQSDILCVPSEKRSFAAIP
jgi:hypothetical protein